MDKDMKRIASFSVDHNLLRRGVYVSRRDAVGDSMVTTLDIRTKRPNREPIMNNGTMHAIEHLGATFLRNNAEWKDRVIYFGPMGCQTGFYLLLAGDLQSRDVAGLVGEMFRFIADYEGRIPGASPAECGHYLSMDLPMAKYESEKFLGEVLKGIDDSRLIYPS
jgi:S-ribosylhomocysteine lyase